MTMASSHPLVSDSPSMPRDKGTAMACEQPFPSLRQLAFSLPVVPIKIQSTVTRIYLKSSDADEGIRSEEVMQMRCTVMTHFYLDFALLIWFRSRQVSMVAWHGS